MIVAGTGHRPDKVGGYSQEAYNKLMLIATEWIQENRPDRVISGMALGWDQALAEAALKLGIPVTAAIPCLRQSWKWTKEGKDKYKSILSNPLVTEHWVSNEKFTHYCMQVRNLWMMDNCDVVLALWDGIPGTGGTAHAVQYAQRKGKRIINLYSKI